MKVALIGAGAVGAYFVWGFGKHEQAIVHATENSAAGDIAGDGTKREFVVVVEGDRKEKLSKNGLKVNGTIYHPTVCTPEEAGICDVIVVAVKSTAIREAAEMLPKIVGENTVVMSMLNGVESEEIIAEKIGWDHVIHSIILIASRRFPNEVIFDESYPTKALYGALDIKNADMKLKMVEDAFKGTDIRFERSRDIMFDEWFKYARNICNNLPQAVVCAPAAIYTRSDHGMFLAEKLWQEVRGLAKVKGVTLPEHAVIYDCADSSRYSTLQDIDNGRRTEVDSLCGYLMNLAAENHVEVPFIEYTYHAIKLLEEKNEGKFD